MAEVLGSEEAASLDSNSLPGHTLLSETHYPVVEPPWKAKRNTYFQDLITMRDFVFFNRPRSDPFFALIYSPLLRRFLADKQPPTWMVAQAIFILIGPSREVEATSHSSHGKIPPCHAWGMEHLPPSLAYFARQEQLLRSKRSFPYCWRLGLKGVWQMLPLKVTTKLLPVAAKTVTDVVAKFVLHPLPGHKWVTTFADWSVLIGSPWKKN